MKKGSFPGDSAGTPIIQYYAFLALVVASGFGLLTVLACWIRRNCRHGRYEYMALEAEGGGQERLEMERKAKEEAHTACSHYLRGCTRYTLIEHLKDIGSRVDKNWFVVRDTSVKTERLLTLVPKGNNCVIKTDQETRGAILELLLNLQHPYIYPVLDLQFTETGPSGQGTYVVLVIPYNAKGSLKDLIYKSMWQEDWCDKYSEKSEGLPLTQVQRLGRQILEALLFLKERGFPSCLHLHSGNVIIQNGVARLSGLENVLFGLTSRIYPVVTKIFRSDPMAIDVVCFGHVLFEMCAGYELTVAVPSATNLMDISGYAQVVEVLDFIFNNPKQRCPSIEELLLMDFFRNIDLREMRATSLPQVYHSHLTPSTVALLNDLKRQQRPRRGRRSLSSSNEPNSPHREHSDSEDEAKGSDEEDEAVGEDEDLTGGSHEDSDSDTAPDSVEHRHLSLHLYQNLNTVKLQDNFGIFR